MSFASKDRNVRARQGRTRADEPPDTFAVEVARALALDYGRSAGKVKIVARLTRSNERTVKNWFAGRNGPSGEGVVALVRHSDEVLRTVLRLAGRNDVLAAMEVANARSRLREAMAAIDVLLGAEDPQGPP